MKFPLFVWISAFSCCTQEAFSRRTQVRLPLAARDTKAQVSDRPLIDPLTKSYDANEADAQGLALQINTTSTASQSQAQLASEVSMSTIAGQESSGPTALLEGRDSNVGEHDKSSMDKHDDEQSNSRALLEKRGSNFGIPSRQSSMTKSEHDEEQSDSNVEKDKFKYDKQQLISAALLKGRFSDVRERNKGRQAHVDNIGLLFNHEKESEEKHGGEERQSTLSSVRSSFLADFNPAFWIVGGMCLLSCFGCCLFAEMVFKKESATFMSVKKDSMCKTLLVSQPEFACDGNSSSLLTEEYDDSVTIDDTEFSQITLQSALAQPYRNQCLLETAQIWTNKGVTDVRDLRAESEIIDTEGEVVRVKSCVPKPNWERDFVEVELDEGKFEVTSSHLLEASTRLDANIWYPWLAGDLRTGLFVRTEVGPRQIIDIHKKPREPVNVIQVELERNATVWLNASGVWVSIFGAQVEEFIEQVHNLVYLKPPCSLYSFKSSASEPNITHFCNGACHHWKTFGKCKYGQDCVDCHIWGCTKAKVKIGKRQRRRVRRDLPDDAISPSGEGPPPAGYRNKAATA